MNGLIYLHNLAGDALAAANAEIERLQRENSALQEQLAQHVAHAEPPETA